MSRILAPHKEQDGWVYVRVKMFDRALKWGSEVYQALFVPGGFPCPTCFAPSHNSRLGSFFYRDDFPNSRVISSRRVEEAVETADYLKRCAEENLSPTMWPGCNNQTRWVVVRQGGSSLGKMTWPTLREAYHRYKAERQP